jgi:phosphatidylglycerol:prolipoprotein diacylglycerol transferase
LLDSWGRSEVLLRVPVSSLSRTTTLAAIDTCNERLTTNDFLPMCSELFRIPYSWGGVPIFGFGVLLAIWAVASGLTLASHVRRYGWGGETLGTIPLLILIGAAIIGLPRLFPDGFPVRGYGVMLLIGISASVAAAMYRARQVGLNPELIVSATIWLVVCGIIGARLFYVVEYWGDRFGRGDLQHTLFEILNFPEGGLVIYGGFIGGILGVLYFTRKHRIPFLALADLAAPSFMIGLAFGRIGCFLNGCCYGGESDQPWAVTFPMYSSRYEADQPLSQRRYTPPYTDQAARGELHGFRIEPGSDQPTVVTRVDAGSPAAAAGLKVGDVIVSIDGAPVDSYAQAKAQLQFDFLETQQTVRLGLRGGRTIDIPALPLPARSLPVHPAQLYSAIDAGLLAWLLWAFYPFRRRDGEVVALMMTIHPITRFLLEIIRVDESAVFGTGLSISQNISLVFLLCAAVLWWWLSQQPRQTVWPRAA